MPPMRASGWLGIRLAAQRPAGLRRAPARRSPLSDGFSSDAIYPRAPEHLGTRLPRRQFKPAVERRPNSPMGVRGMANELEAGGKSRARHPDGTNLQ